MAVNAEKGTLVRAHLPKLLRTLALSVEKLDPCCPEVSVDKKMKVIRALEALAAIDEVGN